MHTESDSTKAVLGTLAVPWKIFLSYARSRKLYSGISQVRLTKPDLNNLAFPTLTLWGKLFPVPNQIDMSTF